MAEQADISFLQRVAPAQAAILQDNLAKATELSASLLLELQAIKGRIELDPNLTIGQRQALLAQLESVYVMTDQRASDLDDMIGKAARYYRQQIGLRLSGKAVNEAGLSAGSDDLKAYYNGVIQQTSLIVRRMLFGTL